MFIVPPPPPGQTGRRSHYVLGLSVCPFVYYAPTCMEGGNKHCFCPSVCPSVAYIANNSRTQRPSLPKFGRKVPHLRCESHTSFKVKRSKIKVARPINADTHPAAYLPNAYILHTAGCLPLFGVFLGHFRINLHQTRTQYSNEGPQHCN